MSHVYIISNLLLYNLHKIWTLLPKKKQLYLLILRFVFNNFNDVFIIFLIISNSNSGICSIFEFIIVLLTYYFKC